MKVELIPPDDPAWAEILRTSGDATAFHHPSWSAVLSDTYGYPAHVLAWRDAARMHGGIPVLRVGKRLVALPFTDHCPPVFADGADEARFAVELLQWQKTSAARLEVRASLAHDAGHPHVVGTRHVVDLSAGADALFRRLHRTWKKRIKTAREIGVEVTLSRSLDELPAFYRLHCETRRRQGVPVQPRRFIEHVWRNVIVPGHGFVITARMHGEPVATALFLLLNRHLIYKYGASDRARWDLGANFLVHWTAIEWACAGGFTSYDLGRTDLGQDGLRAFKAGWGAREYPLVYTHLGSRAPSLERGLAGAAVAQVIKHSPAVVCRALGELLYRYAA